MIAAAVRLLAMYAFAGAGATHGDETYYLNAAISLHEGRGYPGSFRPPGYSAFISGVFAVFGTDPAYARLAQIAVSLFAVFAVFRLTSTRFGPTAGFLSGLACALSAPLVHYTHFLWSEGLTAACVIGFFFVLDAFDRTGKAWLLGLSGLILGLTGLVRETWALFAVFVAVWVLWRERASWRRALGRAVLFAGCTAVVILPWTARNWNLHGSYVLISTCRWFPIAIGNMPEPEEGAGVDRRMQRHVQKVAGKTEIEAEAYWKKVARKEIDKDQPLWFFNKIARNTPKLFTLRSQVSRFLRNGWVETTPGRARLLVATDAAAYAVTLLLGVASLWLVRGSRTKVLMVVAIVFNLLIYIVANATARFVVPLLPLFLLGVGPLLTGCFTQDGVSWWRRIGAAATVIIVAGCLWSSWGGVVRLWESLQSG